MARTGSQGWILQLRGEKMPGNGGREGLRAPGESAMFHQLPTPIGGNLAWYFAVAAIPIAVVLVLLGIVRRPASEASLAGLLSGLAIAVICWKMPAGLALYSAAAGGVFASS